ncbi:hypothetical protein [Gemmatimonas sp.]|uniref:hypothetical protein n=1 Tax=Gemmatimonas sp. TaxID=1962908 RepID=UPI00286DA230|nr:hypothetical protein [Gemmatimonas sp.]
MTVISRVHVVAVALAVVLFSDAAKAQVCAGSSPFSNGNVRLGLVSGTIGAGVGGADGETSFGLQLAAGESRGAFASAFASAGSSTKRFIREEFAASGADDALSNTIGASGGYSVTAPTWHEVELCPMAGFALQNGPAMWRECTAIANGGLRCSGAVDASARALWFGGSVGRLHRVSPRMAFVPFVAAAVVSSRITGDGRSQSDSYVNISLGAGVLAKRMTIRPTLSFPMGLEGGRRSSGLQFAFNIGPKSQPR